MSQQRLFLLVFVVVLSIGPSGAAGPAAQQGGLQDDWCGQRNWEAEREGVCEVREFVVAPGATLTVDAAPNGGIRVDGGPRRDVLVRARIVARAESRQRAQEIASAIHVEAGPDRVAAAGPTGLARREHWDVSYRLEVPTLASLSLQTVNGGISISDVEGRVEFRTVNGGVKLSRLAGEVTGRTTNGGIDVELDGTMWNGTGLDVATSNGGVKLQVPEHYSARLETSTVNGRLNIDFPVTVQGRIDRQLIADLGAGGPVIRVKTQNGGVKITKK